MAAGGGVLGSARCQTDAGGTPNLGEPSQQRLQLTPAQRNAIYAEVIKDKSKSARQQFSAVPGAEVPPMIELYALPDDVAAGNPATKLYQFTIVQDRVVIVDPTNMRVIDVIGPSQ